MSVLSFSEDTKFLKYLNEGEEESIPFYDASNDNFMQSDQASLNFTSLISRYHLNIENFDEENIC